MTDVVRAERLASLKRASGSGRRRRPAEATRILVAGAGTAAVLSMAAAMAQADRAAVTAASEEALIPPVSMPAPASSNSLSSMVVAEPSTRPVEVVSVTPARTVSVSRPAASTSNTRTSGSR